MLATQNDAEVLLGNTLEESKMSKSSEELAQEYVIGEFPDTNSDMFLAAKSVHKAFLAGYKAAQQWISVSDRLPEENQNVLVFSDLWTVVGAQIKEGLWVNDAGGTDLVTSKRGQDSEVTHWMELPEAPNEEEK